ncbi:hypothetical protein AB0J28_15210 [Streptosporangium canum]|uniref:hypothetical protein n=1 Tax=Streptosporangium canum TaxID=324952 RepID=UPI00342D47D5
MRPWQPIPARTAHGASAEVVEHPEQNNDGEFIAPGCDDLIAEFVRERQRIDNQIAELHDVRSALTGIISVYYPRRSVQLGLYGVEIRKIRLRGGSLSW